jgi:hypothetical protein
MTEDTRLPPLEPARRVAATLECQGIACALGGSGLLVALGLAERARDWDFTTDAPLERVSEALRAFPAESMGPNGIHADHKLMLEGGSVEVIVGFSFRSEGRVIRMPTIVTGRWNDLPLGSPEVWAVAYELLERPAKSALLFDWIGRRDPDPEPLARLLAEPLGEALRSRLTRAAPSVPSSET